MWRESIRELVLGVKDTVNHTLQFLFFATSVFCSVYTCMFCFRCRCVLCTVLLHKSYTCLYDESRECYLAC
ncbi:hypothetical protein L218DRAFT_404883 [Marasmius fiardii PR-910]|nr:hypothetical protein L218DRAFT_404883 [Marasmius fiardii PR-910]